MERRKFVLEYKHGTIQEVRQCINRALRNSKNKFYKNQLDKRFS